MKRLEMEQLLMRPERISVLAERAQYLKNKYGENGTTGGEESEKTILVKQLAHDIVQTVGEIKSNDYDVVSRSELMPDLTQFIPDLTNSEPRALLKTLTKKHRNNPSPSKQLLIENVINKITSVEQLNPEDEKVIEDAIKVLMSVGEPKNKNIARSKNTETKRKEG